MKASVLLIGVDPRHEVEQFLHVRAIVRGLIPVHGEESEVRHGP
jgi:hypothetical protein